MRAPMKRFVVTVSCASVACLSPSFNTYEAVRVLAANDFACPAPGIDVVFRGHGDGRYLYDAKGCGKKATYVRAGPGLDPLRASPVEADVPTH